MPDIYKVGGCVRDMFLGVDSKDIDFTFVLDDTDVTVEDGFLSMESWMKDEGFEIFLSTPEMFTIRAKFPKNDQYAGLCADFVMARREIGYVENTRKPILQPGNLYDDLIRRDFTLNALAEDIHGNIIDYFDGVIDLKNKNLKTPLDPKITFFDDPLRILRCLRFKITKGFNIDDSIWIAMANPLILKKLETTVSAERIREELLKMMKYNTVESLKLFVTVEKFIPGFTELIFSKGLWLKPTFEK